MLLGKRPRTRISRTISMTKFSGGFELPEDSPVPSDQNIPAKVAAAEYRKKSADFDRTVETAPFLRSCGLCERSLNLGRDIFMYRGEIAFCSLECRQQLMNQEERKKNSLSSLNRSAPANSPVLEPSDSGETVAAA